MSNECQERYITSSAKQEVHGIVTFQVWKMWDAVKKLCGVPEDLVVNIKITNNKPEEGKIEVDFVKEGYQFNYNTYTGCDCELVIVCFDDMEFMLLQSDFEKIFQRVK